MQIEILDWIQNWFKHNCDGEWEHGEVTQTAILDNPGWEVKGYNHENKIVEFFPAFCRVIEPVEQRTVAAHPRVGSHYGIPFIVKLPHEILVPVGFSVPPFTT